MGAPTVYRSDDADAPVLNGMPGAMVNLLQKCLVDGYGAKAPAGWTMPFISGDGWKAVFRNDHVLGFGKYFRIIEDNTSAYDYGKGAAICGYETMSDIDTGLGRIPAAAGYKWFNKSDTNNTTPRFWIMVADSRGFYIRIDYDDSYATPGPQDHKSRTYYVGDFVPFDLADEYCSGFAAGGYRLDHVWLPYRVEDAVATEVDKCMFRDIDNTQDVTWQLMASGFVSGYPGNSGLIGQINGQYVFTQPFVVSAKSAQRPVGMLPGLHYSLHHFSEFDNFEQISIDGRELYCLHGYVNNQHSQMFIDISEGFRP
jgi:hypothetical protein